LLLIGVVSVIYASLVAIRQIDFKKIIAYSSIAHMGFATIGFSTIALFGCNGAYFTLISHGFISGALFFCVGVLYYRYKTKLLVYFSSLASSMPVFSSIFFFFCLGNISLPGTSGFIGEAFVFVSLVKIDFLLSLLVAFSIVLVVVYTIWLFNRVCFGMINTKYIPVYQDVNLDELCIFIFLFIPVIIFGVCPWLVFEYCEFFMCALLVKVHLTGVKWF